MIKHVQPLSVSTDEGMILIEQEAAEELARIAISPDQVTLLIEWLREAVEELANQDA